MEGSIRLLAKERKTLLQAYRGARIARRALIVLLLAERWSFRRIMDTALVSPTMIAAVKRDFAADGVAQVLGGESRALVVASWLMVVVR